MIFPGGFFREEPGKIMPRLRRQAVGFDLVANHQGFSLFFSPEADLPTAELKFDYSLEFGFWNLEFIGLWA